MNWTPKNDYTIILHERDGSTQEVDEWFTLNVAKKIAAKAYDARVNVVNSPVTAIEIRHFDGSTVQIAKFED